MTICSVRHQGKPLLQPTYNFRDVPTAARGFAGSTISEVRERQHFVDSIAELTLLCSEASRRRKNHRGDSSEKKKISSKPLSIEYIFDRIDTDDPMWGLMVRTDTPMSATGRPSSLKASPQWRRGMLQGFISVTTFTTWKSSFRFDSLHEEAYSWDDVHLDRDMKSGLRKFDEDGSLAAELENTVHGGDPYVEGVVYPRIAEVSLLGGLGCGKTLLKLAIERLECLKPTSNQNYDYVVLQATENSIPFYESMGFTRVGCIQGKAPSPTGYASSPVKKYIVQKEWEKPVDIAKQFGVDVLDVEFLNIPVWGATFKKNVWLKKGTEVFIPLTNEKDANNGKNAPIKWHTAKEDETPRGIQMKYKLKYAEFIAANQRRYPGLVGNSRLKEGTRIQISRFDIDDSDFMPYPHWTFPDDELDEESNEPSYMMALKLNRKFGKAAEDRPVEKSLEAEIEPYSPESCGVKDVLNEPKVSQIHTNKPKSVVVKEPKKPKRPQTPFLLFSNHIRTTKKSKLAGKSFADSNRLISEMWRNASEEEKSPFYEQFEESKPAYTEALQRYEQELQRFRLNNPQSSGSHEGVDTSLLEQVVKLKSTDGIPGHASKYEYFYVLTFIPDLMWVHLIPMRKVGVFDEKHPTSAGRPIWMIVSEEEGKEFDTSSALCKVVSSRTLNNSADADEEQWDIYESGDKPPLAPIFAPRKSQDLKPAATKSESSAAKTPKANKRGNPSQTPASSKQQKKTPSTTASKKKSQPAAIATPKSPAKINSKKRKRSPTKTPKNSTARWPKRSTKVDTSTESMIASKVEAGTCAVKVRLSGQVYDTLQSLEDVELGHNTLNPRIIKAIKSGACSLKVRAAGEIVDPSVEEKEEAKANPRAPLHSSERKLAPIFMKKYTRSVAKASSPPNSPRRNKRDRSPLRSPRNKKVNTPRRSPRVQRNINTPENQDALSAVVSDDGSSQEVYMPRRKRTRTQ